MIVVDGHLDIAFNHFAYDRDPRESALTTREREGELASEPWRGMCTVGLPEMGRGRVALAFPTLFIARARDDFDVPNAERVTYDTAEEAEKLGGDQLDFYHRWAEEEGSGVRLIGTVADLEESLAAWADGGTGDVGLVPLMEGADPIVRPADAAAWFERGIRLVGLAWRGTRYSGGTSEPGPLTDLGRELVPELDRTGIILDLSHAAEESFYEALDLYTRPVIASHSNARAICPGDRQLSDDMIRRIAHRGGVIGAVPFNAMLHEGWRDRGRPTVPLRRFAEAIHHVAEAAGTHKVAAIGSDFDGGFGAEATPDGLDTIADLPRVADELADLGFSDPQIADVLGGNWIRFLRENLPAAE